MSPQEGDPGDAGKSGDLDLGVKSQNSASKYASFVHRVGRLNAWWGGDNAGARLA
jgi:hypothetical protein